MPSQLVFMHLGLRRTFPASRGGRTFDVQHELVAEMRGDGPVLVQAPFLVGTPVFGPQGHAGPRHGLPSDQRQARLAGLQEQSTVHANRCTNL